MFYYKFIVNKCSYYLWIGNSYLLTLFLILFLIVSKTPALSASHSFSVVFKSSQAICIFSSSNVIKAFCNAVQWNVLIQQQLTKPVICSLQYDTFWVYNNTLCPQTKNNNTKCVCINMHTHTYTNSKIIINTRKADLRQAYHWPHILWRTPVL